MTHCAIHQRVTIFDRANSLLAGMGCALGDRRQQTQAGTSMHQPAKPGSWQWLQEQAQTWCSPCENAKVEAKWRAGYQTALLSLFLSQAVKYRAQP